jgi:hypothetical protein
MQIRNMTQTIFFGGKAKATALCSKWFLCDPSQNGLFWERPQRQTETSSLPPKSYRAPVLSTISKSPSILKEPLSFTVIFVLAIQFKFKYENRHLFPSKVSFFNFKRKTERDRAAVSHFLNSLFK